jgi:hypothetical protein
VADRNDPQGRVGVEPAEGSNPSPSVIPWMSSELESVTRADTGPRPCHERHSRNPTKRGDAASLNSVTPILLFAVTFGLSMDYMVIMMSRVRELHLPGWTHRRGRSGGHGRTAPMVTRAAVIMVAVFAAFVTATLAIVQQFGVGLAVAVLLDAVVI